MLVQWELLRDQLRTVFEAWGMSTREALITATVMAETDLRGIDSHGISMLPSYDVEFRKGRLNMQPHFRTLRESPATALIDADAAMGQPVSVHAMNLAVEKCLASGVAVVSVVNSHHFGAAGSYTRIATDRGLIGMATTATRGIYMVPTFAAEPVLGTNPLAFAAPAGRNPPFHLDMATTTVAAGKVRVHRDRHEPIPAGWVVDGLGAPVTDEADAWAILADRPEGGITPLGGTPEMASYKGYGLAVMAHILGGTLGGASFSPIREQTQGASEPSNLGHFFLAINPRAFREDGAFEEDLDQVIDVLHAARPANPAQPVLVAGDPQRQLRLERSVTGVPVPDDLIDQVREVVARAGVPFILAG